MKLVVTESETATLRRTLTTLGTVVSSRLAFTEVIRATRRRDASADEHARRVLSEIVLVAVSTELLYVATDVVPSSLGTLDAIHVATARDLGHDLAAFVAYDRRLLAAATEAGLPVLSPS